MSLINQLNDDLKNAMKNGDRLAMDTVRSLKTALKNAEISKGDALTEEEALAVLRSEAKKRKESAAEYRKGGRPELAETEEKELNIISGYLPAQMSEEEIKAKVEEMFAKVNPASAKEIGKVMGPLMKELKGKADGRLVQQLVKQKFESI